MHITSEKLIICGQGGSGKDYLLDQLKKRGFKTSVKTTTRPKRITETEGIDYLFKNREEFINSDMIVREKFYNHLGDEWLYGIETNQFDKGEAFIMTPGEIEQLPKEVRKNCFVVFLNIDESVRRNRLSKRKDYNDSSERRLKADKLDFENFTDYDMSIQDPEFSVDDIISLME